MIQFQILKSPDDNVLREYKFHQNLLYIGRTSGDFCIQDPELSRSHIMIEVVEENLLIHPQKNVSHYLINGKRATEIRKIKPGESLTIGGTLIKILAYNNTPSLTKKQILDSKMAQLMKEDSERLGLIENLVRMSK
jgi:hypothetical protein